jgi:hypothetical protein
MKKITTRTAELTELEDNLFLCRLFDNTEIDEKDSQENFEAAISISGGKPYAMLVDARVHITLTKQAMEHSAQPVIKANEIASAILVDSLANRILGNFKIRFTKSANTMRLFTDEETALRWLRDRIQKHNHKNMAHLSL